MTQFFVRIVLLWYFIYFKILTGETRLTIVRIKLRKRKLDGLVSKQSFTDVFQNRCF